MSTLQWSWLCDPFSSRTACVKMSVGLCQPWQGRRCGGRLLVHDAIYDNFIDAFVERVDMLRVALPKLPICDIGPMHSQKDIDAFEEELDNLRNQCSTVKS